MDKPKQAESGDWEVIVGVCWGVEMFADKIYKFIMDALRHRLFQEVNY